MAETVYVMCAITSLFCATLLVRRYRTQRIRLLLWSSLCFVGFALNNTILVIDLLVIPNIDLSTVRASISAVAMLMMLVGFIWESR